MKVTIKPGESVDIELEGTDGEFSVHFDTKEHPQAVVVKESAGLEGNVKGGANEILYEEIFDHCYDKKE